MRSAFRAWFFLWAATAAAAELPYFTVLSEDAGGWPAILSSIGLQQKPAGSARVFVARVDTGASPEWRSRVERGGLLIVEGASSLAEMFGFRPTAERFPVQSVMDVHRPALPIIWEHGLELPVFQIPTGAQVFARDRWSKFPVMAGIRVGSGGVLWVIASPGERGYERFPYLLAALTDLGFEPPFRSSRLWAFLDSSYRSRVDLDYFAARWRRTGIAALHVAAWHFYEREPEGDRYLERLIEACHREGILVYAWLELPHVSERFWTEHPEWREKTGLRQDAHLDWRKLMNLANRDCFRTVSSGISELLSRFDWDGVNLAELYFESLEGIGNPARFTPMNEDVRAAFQSVSGFDPMELFGTRKGETDRKLFLDFRSELAARMQEEWLAVLEGCRKYKPYFDLALTHVDDRGERSMRDNIGADASRLLPLLDKYRLVFLVEDPATVWHQEPQRYVPIAERYRALTRHHSQLAVDVNIAERYQDVYPTKQQTGVELFQVVHQAAASFPRVALYSESSLSPPDLPLISSAAAVVTRVEGTASQMVIESNGGVGIPWKGGALVDGQPWAAISPDTLWLPGGSHSVEPAADVARLHLVRFTGELGGAHGRGGKLQFSYSSSGRAIAIFDASPQYMELDGVKEAPQFAGPMTILLPRGQHVVTLAIE